MNNSIDIPEPRAKQALLHRVSSACDLPSLITKSIRKSRQSSSFASVRRYENNGSKDSEALYMASSKKSTRKDRSLSLVSANSFRRMDGSFDERSGSEAGSVVEVEDTIDEPSQDIIDQEIFEWQWVCRTGRPFWWSPQSKYSRQRHSPSKLSNGYGPRVWISELGDGQEPEHDTKRRAVSDSVLAGLSTADELAQMAAIRLLGSCFTLPPELITSGPPLNSKMTTKNGSSSYLDPRMITCLRMQTYYRYSPCYGHQPRNTSPTRSRDSTFDGAFPNSSAPDTGMQTPVIGSSSRISRRRKGHRAQNVTERSTGSYRDSSADEDPLVASTLWHRRQGGDDDPSNRISVPKRLNTGKGRFRKASQNDQIGTWRPRAGDKSLSPNTHYALQPVIRSEPHHVFIQPVRELVVKRWNNIRRRFGGSLHSALPSSASEDQSQLSRPGASSPMMSSDGKERRRRARERGEISSHEDMQHFNSPASEQLSPNGSGKNSPYMIDSAKTSPGFALADPFAAAAALALAEGHTNFPWNRSPLSEADSPQPDRLLGPPNSPASSSSIPTRGASSQPVSSPPATTRNSRSRSRRKSQLSEVITAEDLSEEPNIYIDHATSHESPAVNRQSSILASTMEEAEPATPHSTNRPIGDYFGVKRTTTRTQERPRFLRMNTSGTQIFSTNDEGVEVDGLPAGLPKETWQGADEKQKSWW